MAHPGGQDRWFMRFGAGGAVDRTCVTDCTYKIDSLRDHGRLCPARCTRYDRAVQKGESPVFPPRLRESQTRTGFVVLLALLACQLAWTARRNSITWDEDDHIYAGYMSLRHGDFGLNPEHPPLVKQLAAVPLLPMTLKMPPLEGREFKHEAFLGGQDFIFRNDAEKVLFRARMSAALLTILLATLIFFAAREMFGAGAGLVALALFVFDPNVLAHGAVVGTDMGLSCFMFATIYAFYRYVKMPSLGRFLWVGIALGLTFASKHTGILLVRMLLLLSLAEIFREGETQEGTDSAGKRAGRLAVAFVVVSAMALTTVGGLRLSLCRTGRRPRDESSARGVDSSHVACARDSASRNGGTLSPAA